MGLRGVWHVITRRKVPLETDKEGLLSRCLGTRDLTALGVGSTLGVGVYVLAGHVARDDAGPSVILSFLLAAIVSMFAGLCYAELGSKVPQAGSAYVYAYVCIGEFIAFIIGWNLILEYVIGSASVSRGISLYLDTLLNNVLKDTFREIAPIDVPFLSDYFDFFSFGLSILLGVVLAFGLKKSSTVNSIFTLLNVCVIIFVIVAGSIKADLTNWNISEDSIPEEDKAGAGAGGFFPFGWSGMISGAATCFFGFVGFDCIATTGEEVKNPKRAIPTAIVISLIVIFLSYFGVSTVITLMLPYYLQDRDAPIPHAFDEVGWLWAKWIVTIGGMFGLFTSLFGAMFPLPRILFAMASDGLIFKFLGTVNPTFRTPVVGTLLAAILTGTMGGIFEMKHLIKMMSIGTLMAYTIVAACVVVHRYEDGKSPLLQNAEQTESSYLMYRRKSYSFGAIMKQIFKCPLSSDPSHLSSIIVRFSIAFYCVFSLAFSFCLMYLLTELTEVIWWAVAITSLFGGSMLIFLLIISSQPQSKMKLSTSFEVPWVPLIPCLSIFCNVYLMLMLDVHTWIRFGVWMALGLPVYLICICLYDRGTNYLTHAQKSSMNGNSISQINYASESFAECRERTVSFAPGVKVIQEIGTNSDADCGPTLVIPSQYMSRLNDEHQTKSHPDDVHIDIPIENRAENREITENGYLECEPILPEGSGEIQIIELLDKMLAEEEASAACAIDISEEPFLDPVTPSLDLIVNTPVVSRVDCVSSSGEVDLSLVQPSESNVVVLVHREDGDSHREDSSDDETSLRLDRFNSISITSPGNLSECVNTELNETDPGFEDVKHLENKTESVNDNTESKKVEEDKIFIPIPPPIDEAYFNRPIDKIIKLKNTDNTKKYERKTSQAKLKPSRKPSIDVSAHLKSGTDRQSSFKLKLAGILQKKPPTQKKSKRTTIANDDSPKTETDDNHHSAKDKHSSESDLAMRSSDHIDNDSDSSDSVKRGIENGKQSEATVNESEIDKALRSNKTKPAEDIQPLSKKDIKLKLESIFKLSPKLGRSKSNAVKNDKEENAHTSLDRHSIIGDEDDEILKPKSRESYTNTMKLKRAQFDNVLKSMVERVKRDSVNS